MTENTGYVKQLAKITHASLMNTPYLHFSIIVEYESGGTQNIGCVRLDKWDETKNHNIGTAFGCELIRRLFEELDVNDFSEMKNIIIWVLGTKNDTYSFIPKGIQNLRVNTTGKRTEGVIYDDVYNDFVTDYILEDDSDYDEDSDFDEDDSDDINE